MATRYLSMDQDGGGGQEPVVSIDEQPLGDLLKDIDPDPQPAPAAPHRPEPAPQGQAGDAQDAPPDHPSPQGEGPTVEYVNHADLVLNTLLGGGDGGPLETIDFDGEPVRVADLTEEQQAEVIANSIEDLHTYYQGQLEELRAARPQSGGEADISPAEAAVLQAMRQGDTRAVVQAMEQHDPAVAVARMSPEERVRHALRQQHPTYTDQDLDEELADMSPQQIERRSRAVLAQAESQRQTDYSYLQPEGDEAADIDEQIQQVSQYASTVRQIDGIDLAPENLAWLTQHATAYDPQTGMTPLTRQLSTPEGLLRTAFWNNYGPVLYRHLQGQLTQARQEGQQEGRRQTIATYPDQPQHTPSGRAPQDPNRQMTDKELDNLINQVDRIGS